MAYRGKILKGKVLRVPAEVKLTQRQQTIPFIVGDEKKVREAVALMGGLHFCMEEYCKLLSGFGLLTGTSSIEQVLSVEEDCQKEKFGKAKFIAKLDNLKSDTHNYYYIVEDLPEKWSVADVIVCFANAYDIQDRLEKLLPKCFFEGSATLNFNDDLPIVRIPKSMARYIAEHKDTPYVKSDTREILRINKVLAHLMISEVANSNDPQIQLVRPVVNVRELFAVENSELAELLSKVQMIKKLDVQDDENDYFYIVVDDMKLNVVDIIGHQVAISRASSPVVSTSRSCDCSTCPYYPFFESEAETQKLAFLSPLVKKRMTAVEELSLSPSADMEVLKKENIIRNAIEDIYGPGSLDLYDEYFNDEQKALIRDNILKRFQDYKMTIEVICEANDCKSRYNMRMFCDNKEMKFKSKDRAIYGPYLLILHSLFNESYRMKNPVMSLSDVSFPFSLTVKPDQNNADYYNRECIYPDKKTKGDKTYGYYNAKLAILFGLLYDSFIYGNRSSGYNILLICNRLGIDATTDIEFIIDTVLKQDDEWYNISDKELYYDYEKVAFNLDGNPYRASSYESINKTLFGIPGGKYREILSDIELVSDNPVFNKLIDEIKKTLLVNIK